MLLVRPKAAQEDAVRSSLPLCIVAKDCIQNAQIIRGKGLNFKNLLIFPVKLGTMRCRLIII